MYAVMSQKLIVSLPKSVQTTTQINEVCSNISSHAIIFGGVLGVAGETKFNTWFL